eukprot:m.221193 g.221193  ORF g.221193 m.221193 type:complete len:1088 (+) comp19182_c0_seq1:631-3894(+)
MGYPVEQQKYQALGAVHIDMNYSPEHLSLKKSSNNFETFNIPKTPSISGYCRWLDLDSGVAHVSYTAEFAPNAHCARRTDENSISRRTSFRREVFASYDDNVIAIRLTADRPRSLSLTASLRGKRNMAHSNYGTNYFRMDRAPSSDFNDVEHVNCGDVNDKFSAKKHIQSAATVILRGKGDDYLGIKGCVEYEARMTAVCERHDLRTDVPLDATARYRMVESTDDAEIVIRSADSVTFYIVAATSFVSHKDAGGNAHTQAVSYARQLFRHVENRTRESCAVCTFANGGTQNPSADMVEVGEEGPTSQSRYASVCCRTEQLYSKLKCRAVEDHQKLFRRVHLSLPHKQSDQDSEYQSLPTPERVHRAQLVQDAFDRSNGADVGSLDVDNQDADDMTSTTGDYSGGSVVHAGAAGRHDKPDSPAGDTSVQASHDDRHDGLDAALVPLVYNMGRYLLIASSRPGTRAANLQGIWSLGQNPSWDSKFTTNINLQMNYWIADSGNLGECAQPLVELVCDVAAGPGAAVARKTYGIGPTLEGDGTEDTHGATAVATTTTTTVTALPSAHSGMCSSTTTNTTTTTTTTTRSTPPRAQSTTVAKDGSDPWVLHQNTDVWLAAAPMDGPTWGTFTVGGAWLATHLWERYLHTLDRAWLARKAYPVLCGAVRFFLAFLVQHPRHPEWLVTAPSTSPENPPDGPGYERFFDEVTGMVYFTTIVAGASIDSQILHDLFGYYIAASECLERDDELRRRVAAARSRLVPWAASARDGALQEWVEDYGQQEAHHRHISHLYGLFPGRVLAGALDPTTLPAPPATDQAHCGNGCDGPVGATSPAPSHAEQLRDALQTTLEQRGDGGKGFSRAWKAACWARLRQGDRALRIVTRYLRDQATPSLFAKCGHSLQVDGALGMSAAISELLVQSHMWCACDEGVKAAGHRSTTTQHRVIDVLPALPSQWVGGSVGAASTAVPSDAKEHVRDGSFRGVRVRGAFELDMTWECRGNARAATDGGTLPARTHPDVVTVVVTSCARVARPCVLRVAWACYVTVERMPPDAQSAAAVRLDRDHEMLPAHACVVLSFDETSFDCRFKVVFSVV